MGPPEESWDGGLGLRAWGSGGPYVPRLVPALPAQSAGSQSGQEEGSRAPPESRGRRERERPKFHLPRVKIIPNLKFPVRTPRSRPIAVPASSSGLISLKVESGENGQIGESPAFTHISKGGAQVVPEIVDTFASR